MKLILLYLMLISLTCFSQTKQDSLGIGTSSSLAQLQAAANKFIDSTVNKTNLNEFRSWLYENFSAKKYDEFMFYYNSFLQNKYSAWIEAKKKQKKTN